MTDRELLELAAKAAGYIVQQHVVYGEHAPGAWVYEAGSALDRYGEPRIFLWRPRDDDGDAFRLAARLKIDIIYTNIHSPRVHAVRYGAHSTEEVHGSSSAATRLAIFRAAAEIGKAMP
jgi:hypothetical protein